MVNLIIELRRANPGLYSAKRLHQFAADEIERLQLIIQRCHGDAARALEGGNTSASTFAEALQHIVDITTHSSEDRNG